MPAEAESFFATRTVLRETMPLVNANSYIEPVWYNELVVANREARIDPRSTEILEREKPYIEKWRSVADVGRSPDEVEKDLSGLALSGGGIRSATFALGVTQAFAAQDLMRRFDYLSTVSGGGYLGSSLTWLTRNTESVGSFAPGMDPQRFPYPIDAPERQTNRRSTPAQDAQLIYLRQHGKYLIPGRGIDLVSAIAVVLRGIMLNLLVWLPITAFILLLIRSLPSADAVLPLVVFKGRFPGGYGWVALVSALAALGFATLSVMCSLRTYLRVGENQLWYLLRRRFETDSRYVLSTMIATLPLALLSLSSGAAREWLASLGFVSIASGIASAVGTFVGSRSISNKQGLSLSVVAPLGAVL